MKRVVESSKSSVLMVIKPKEKHVYDSLTSCDQSHKHELCEIIYNYDGAFQELKGLSPKREI